MSATWQFILNESSVEFLIAYKASHREFLLQALHKLAESPTERGDFQAKDDTGRTVNIRQVGRFLIPFWSDALVKELRVIHLEWI